MLTQRILTSGMQAIPQGLVLLSTQIVTGPVASVSFNSGIDATYDQYWLEWNNISSASGNALMQANLIVGGTPATTGYLNHYSTATNASGATYTSAAPTAYILCHTTLGAGVTDAGAGTIALFGAASTDAKTYTVDAVSTYSTAAAITITVGNGAYVSNPATPVTGVQFTATSGFASGTFRLYGVRNK